MSDLQVYKTIVTIEVGCSVQTPDGDWEKFNASVGTEVGPGYPTAEFMNWCVKTQMNDACAAVQTAINDNIVQPALEKQK